MQLTELVKKLQSKMNLNEPEMTLALEEMFANPNQNVCRQFLEGLYQKGESFEEILSVVRYLKKNGRQIKVSDPDVIDCCGTGGDAKNTFNISTAVAFVLAGGGCCVAKHGNRAVSSQSGSADILAALGINIAASEDQVKQCLEEIGIGFLFAPNYYPELKHVADLRKSISHRTIFNSVGPLLSPVRVKKQLIGVFDARLTEIVARVAKQEGADSVLVVHGDDGLDEFTLTTTSHVSRLHNGQIENFIFDPTESGYPFCHEQNLKGGSPEFNAARLRQTLKGHSEPIDHVVHINAAWGFVVAGKADNFLDGLLMAQDSISSGRAYQKLERLIEATR